MTTVVTDTSPPHIVVAHTTHTHIDLVENFPDHMPREQDPHYVIFNDARAKMAREGKLVCFIGVGCQGGIELHHNLIEYALINDVDWQRFSTLYPEYHIQSQDDLLRWAESEEALLPLCVKHHRGVEGIHLLPYPLWIIQRYLKPDVPLPATVILKERKPHTVG